MTMAMAIIKPFRGVRYDPEKIPDLSLVVSQPYDRVRHGLQERYHELSPYNVVRLIKGREQTRDGEDGTTLTRARDTYRSWLREGILLRDQTPAFYVLRQTFSLPDGRVGTRLGLMAALELSRFDEGLVLPHEGTLPAMVEGRLDLLRATAVNFGTVLMLHSGGRIDELLASITTQPPAFALREFHEHDVKQEFWVLTDPGMISTLSARMALQRNLIIADGHHRYTAALRYRDEMRARHADAPPDAAFNYCLVTLVSMTNEDLVILPTHRLIHAYRNANRRMNAAEALRRAEEYFEIRPVSGRAELEARMSEAKGEPRPCLGFYNGIAATLTLRQPEVMERLLPNHAPDWCLLDVTVAHELLIERVLGIDKQAVKCNECIEFLRDPQRGYEAVDQGRADLMLLMNPTRIEQVQACTLRGEIMPQKSTDFYPKMITGLVMLPVGAARGWVRVWHGKHVSTCWLGA